MKSILSKMQSESKLHESISSYLKMQYPNVIFNVDLSGVKLSKLQAIRAAKLRSSKGFPDVVIYEPRAGHSGLFLELKRAGTRIHKKDGITFATDHLREQAVMLENLSQRGFEAHFAVGFESAKYIIDTYLRS